MGKHTPRAEQRRLVDLWHASEGSMAGFARSHGVQPGTFATWVKRHRLDAAHTGFLRLALPPETDVLALDTVEAVVVQVGDQLLRFERPPPPGWFAAVLRELASC
jgi:transposase-like protein